MSRLDYLTIGIVALCIAALIYLVYRYVNLPHASQNPVPNTEKPYVDTTQTTTKDTAGYPAEDNGTVRPSEGAVVENEKPAETLIKEETKPKPAAIKPQVTPNTGNAATAETNASAALSSGRYMVIAGSFKQNNSAQKRLEQVQKLGYTGARIEKFNRGTYASVLVNRFNNSNDAKALVNTLKGKGVDAMVLKKN